MSMVPIIILLCVFYMLVPVIVIGFLFYFISKRDKE